MIDKKPFRVTNEQVLAVKNMINGRPFIYAAGNELPADWFAADLLDSRELNDKQEALIKEMREVLSSNLRDMDKIDQVCAIAGVHPYTIMRSEISAILEKTKDFA